MQTIQYLGFLIDSREMQIRLTKEKVTQLVLLSREAQQKQALLAREIAQLIWKMTATLPAVYQALLWYCKLQCLKNQEVPVLRSASVTEPGSPDGVEVVVNQNGASQQNEYIDAETRLDGGDECIIAGLGRRLQGHMNRRPMVPDRVGSYST